MNFAAIFLIKPFFLCDQKAMPKTVMSLEQKELLRRNKKRFSPFLMGFQRSK